MEPMEAIYDVLPEVNMLQHVYGMAFEEACDTVLAELVAKRLKGRPEPLLTGNVLWSPECSASDVGFFPSRVAYEIPPLLPDPTWPDEAAEIPSSIFERVTKKLFSRK